MSLFVRLAKLQTIRRDFNKLRQAIRSHDPAATELAWDKCERWLSCLSLEDE